jgi:hypothetical protein
VFSAETGITKVAIDFLGFKAEELKKNADNQWSLLLTSNLTGNDKYVEVTRAGIADFARSLIRSDSELIFAIDAEGKLAMNSRTIDWKPGELEALQAMRKAGRAGYNSFTLEGIERVGQLFEFVASAGPTETAPRKTAFQWYVVVSEARDTFFQGVREINTQMPIFFIHGSKDKVVPVKHSKWLYDIAKERNFAHVARDELTDADHYSALNLNFDRVSEWMSGLTKGVFTVTGENKIDGSTSRLIPSNRRKTHAIVTEGS